MIGRTHVLLALALFLSLAAAGCLQTGSPYYYRDDFRNQYYMTGYLTWTGNQFGIAWDPKATTEDPGGPPPQSDLTKGARAAAGWNLRMSAGTDAGLIPVDTFTSAPFPTSVYLNASRMIQVDLFLWPAGGQQSLCSGTLLDLELWIGTTFAGGQIHGGYQPWNAPPVPPYCTYVYRFHPEIDRVNQGDVLTLKVIHHSEYAPFQYGMGSGHRSVLRLAYFSPEDVRERIHGIMAVEPEPSDGSGAPMALGWSLFGLAALSLGAAARRRPLLVVALLAGVAFAGCLAEEPTDLTEGDPKKTGSVVVEHEDIDHGTAAGTEPKAGSIAGTVVDEDGFPLNGAHVAILETSLSTFADLKGNFRFSNVSAGIYKLRVDKQDYKSIESPVTVLAGKIAKVRVQMEPLVVKEAGFKRHQHDNWNQQLSMPLSIKGGNQIRFKEYASAQPQPIASCTYVAVVPLFSSAGTACSAPFLLEDGHLVQPGTRDVEVKVTWNPSQNQVERVGIGFIANNDLDWWNETWMYPKKNGVPTHIRSTWEMTDIGHQKYNTWQMWLYIPTNSGGGLVPTSSSWSQIVTAPFNVEITIHKGTVPYEPAHVDFWGTNSTYQVADRVQYPMWGCIACQFPADGYGWPSYEAPLNVTPPDTKWLEILLERPTVGTTSGPDWLLAYKPANVRYVYAETAFIKMPSPMKDGNKVSYKLAIKPEESDPFYAPGTGWMIVLDDNTDGYTNTYDPLYNPKAFYLTVVAHRTPTK